VSTLRIFQVGLEEEPPPEVVSPKLRIFQVGFTSSADPTPPRLRIFQVGMTWTPGLTIAPFADVGPMEPETPVTITANLVDYPTLPDSFTWRQISGPTVNLPSGGQSLTFITPSYMQDDIPTRCEVVIGVRATIGSTTSLEQTCKILVRPQLKWRINSNGTLTGRKPYQSIDGG